MVGRIHRDPIKAAPRKQRAGDPERHVHLAVLPLEHQSLEPGGSTATPMPCDVAHNAASVLRNKGPAWHARAVDHSAGRCHIDRRAS